MKKLNVAIFSFLCDVFSFLYDTSIVFLISTLEEDKLL